MMNRRFLNLLLLATTFIAAATSASICNDANKDYRDKLVTLPTIMNLDDLASKNLIQLRQSKSIASEVNAQHCEWLKKRDQWLAENLMAIDNWDWAKRCSNIKPLYTLYVDWLNQQHAFLKKINKEPKLDYPSLIEVNSDHTLGLVQTTWTHQVKNVQQQSQLVQVTENRYSTLDPSCGSSQFSFFTLEDSQDNKLIDSLLTPELLKVKKQPQEGENYSRYLYQQGFYDYIFTEEFVKKNPKYISLKHQFYEFTGGAHGNHALFLFTLDLKKGKKLTLDKLIATDKKEAFMKAALDAFIKNNDLKKDETLQSQGFWFEPTRENGQEKWRLNDDFYVPENFLIGEEGLLFCYQTYEIAPYAFGHPQFRLNWEDLRPFLNDAWSCLPCNH